MRRFGRFACIDWSGAKGTHQKGIAVAECDAGGGAPRLVPSPGERHWSRRAILAWLLGHARAGSDILIGIDFSPSLPYLDQGGFFPGWDMSPPDARALWRTIDALSADDPHFGIDGVIHHPALGEHFRQVGRKGNLFGEGRGRMRETERRAADAGFAHRVNPASCFNLIGANQVGKSSLTGMRVLHRLDGRIPFWPFDAAPGDGPLLVEIYTSIAARAAGRASGRAKMRSAGDLADALARLGAPPAELDRHDDHSADAVLAAAWLRAAAHDPVLWPALWRPRHDQWELLTRTEGWTFGVP